MTKNVENIFFRIWYWYISVIDKKADVIFMNYGYSRNKHQIKLGEKDEVNRYSAQLYDFIARNITIEGKDILEIGCGRGGGLSYINRYLSPNSATGLDLNNKAIGFCKRHYSHERIAFLQGNAENLAFQDNTFDVVINVESSHRYAQMDKFLCQVYRVLKPGGFFLIADFRYKDGLQKLNVQLENTSFILVKDEIITANVLEALKLSSAEREKLISRLVPKFLHNLSRNFAATAGSPTYNKFATQELEYFSYVLRK